jgi:hypothetical protein
VAEEKKNKRMLVEMWCRAHSLAEKLDELNDPCRRKAVAIGDLNRTGGLTRRFYMNGLEIGHHGAINCVVFSIT